MSDPSEDLAGELVVIAAPAIDLLRRLVDPKVLSPQDERGDCQWCGAYLDLDHPHEAGCAYQDAKAFLDSLK